MVSKNLTIMTMKTLILSMALFFLAGVPIASATQRVALVIGNSSYATAPLDNPENDSKAIAKQLSATGFKVLHYDNLRQAAMYDAIDNFISEARQAKEIFFFYAGHAIQVNGRNYLIPVDAVFSNGDLLSMLFDLRYFMDKLAALKSAQAKIIVLDACRDNPFSKHPLAGSGLAEISAPVGSFIAFSTAPGKTAEDGEGEHSPYVSYLLQAISIPGRKIEDVFKEVRAKVNESTKGRQIPWEATSLEVDFCFWPRLDQSRNEKSLAKKHTSLNKRISHEVKNQCNKILMKLSLGMEGLNIEEQKLLQTDCR